MVQNSLSAYIVEKRCCRVAEHLKHWCCISIEQRHSISQLVADKTVPFVLVSLRQRGPGQSSPVITEVILYRRCLHLVFVEFQDKLQDLGQLFDQGLLGFQVLSRRQIPRAQLAQYLRDDTLCKTVE